MPAESLKITGAIALFIIAIVGGGGAALLYRSKQASSLFCLGNAFSGGVFLGAGMLHLLPEAAETLNHLDPVAQSHLTPWAFLLASTGFLLILFIEKVAPSRRDFDETVMIDQALGETPQLHSTNEQRSSHPSILLVALSIHSILAGIALGVEQNAVQVATILLAILAHKFVASAALGITLSLSHYPKAETRRLLLIFALMTPLGVIFGSSMLNLFEQHLNESISAIFNAIAAGTFIYIATMDIINETFYRPQLRWQKFGVLLLGFGTMAFLR